LLFRIDSEPIGNNPLVLEINLAVAVHSCLIGYHLPIQHYGTPHEPGILRYSNKIYCLILSQNVVCCFGFDIAACVINWVLVVISIRLTTKKLTSLQW